MDASDGHRARFARAAAAVMPAACRVATPDLEARVFDALRAGDEWVDSWHTHIGGTVIADAQAGLGVSEEEARWAWKATAHALLLCGMPIQERSTTGYAQLAIAWDHGARRSPIG